MVNNVFCTLLQAILSLIVMWQIAISAIALYGIILIALLLLARFIQMELHRVQKNDNSPKLAVEIIENVKTIQLLTREEYFLNKYVNLLKEVLPNEKKVSLPKIKLFFCLFFLFLGIYIGLNNILFDSNFSIL